MLERIIDDLSNYGKKNIQAFENKFCRNRIQGLLLGCTDQVAHICYLLSAVAYNVATRYENLCTVTLYEEDTIKCNSYLRVREIFNTARSEAESGIENFEFIVQ